MNEEVELIKNKISAAETKLVAAEAKGDDELIKILYVHISELQKEKNILLAAAASSSSSSSSAAPVAATGFDNFRNLLKYAGRELDAETAIIIKTRMPARVQVVESLADAIMLLEDATRLPHSTTVARLKTTCDLIVDGEFEQSGRSTMIRAFSLSTRRPKILKFTTDAKLEYDLFSKLGFNDVSDCAASHLVPLEHLISDEHGKSAVVMPMYSCTIGTPPYLSEENVLCGLKEILSGLMVLHEHGIVHNDIKPGNVLMDMKGRWHICDYGSCTTVDTSKNRRVDYTPMYIPIDFKKRRTKGFDYLLAIVTVLDCISGRTFCSNEFRLRDIADRIATVVNVELRDLLLFQFGKIQEP